MERLKQISKRLADSAPGDYYRYLFHCIDWRKQLIVILGQRGVGKTTLLLQLLSKAAESALYLSLDDFYWEKHRLAEVVESLYVKGYRHLFLDEVHRYPYWSADLKIIYDAYPEIRMVVTGSSLLELSRGRADLSRRAVVYELPGLSFREYLELQTDTSWPALTLEEILRQHQSFAAEVEDKLEIKPYFQQYLRQGYYPFFKEGNEVYARRFQEVLDLILELDVATVEELSYATVRKMRSLLMVISQVAPFKPNVSNLAKRLEASRNTVLKMIDNMARAGILQLLHSDTGGMSYLQKPEKIYLHHPNHVYLLAEGKPSLGAVRETFFLHQLSESLRVQYSRYADFLVDGRYTFEIGGATKTPRQLKGIPESYLALDNLSQGTGRRIPLWMFGFLY